jgi:hypothetical protein
MRNRIFLFAVAGAVALSAGAFALPRDTLAAGSGVVLARVVCDQDGNCWREATPAEGIIGGVLGGIEGRSVHRDDDGDRRMDRRRHDGDRDGRDGPYGDRDFR